MVFIEINTFVAPNNVCLCPRHDFLRESFITHNALVFKLTRVHTHVLQYAALLSESLVADSALERLQLDVHCVHVGC